MLYTQPWPYFFVLLLPTFFVLHAHFFDSWRNPPRPAIAVIVLFGVIVPALRIPVALRRDNSYQRYNVRLATAMLPPCCSTISRTLARPIPVPLVSPTFSAR